MKGKIEICKRSGEPIDVITYPVELAAQNAFDKLEEIKYPNTYKGLTMNLSEYDDSRTIGYVRLIAISDTGTEYCRRELFRKA